MINFPYILGGGQALSFDNNGYFLYPESVVITKNVSNIGNYERAFRKHTELKSVTFEENSALSDLSGYSFQGCSNLQSIKLPPNRILISSSSIFQNCSKLEIADFTGCTLTNINNGSSCFDGCYALSQESFESFLSALSSSNTVIPSACFQSCRALTNVVIPAQITTIRDYAFRYCTSIESINFKNTITFGSGIANGCTALKRAVFEASPTTSNSTNFMSTSTSNPFYDCTALEDIQIPSGWLINTIFSTGGSHFTNVLTHDSMVRMLENLYDYSGGTAHTLTLGAVNLARLSAEEIAVATAKNWTLA